MSLNFLPFLLSCISLLGCSVAMQPKGLTMQISTTNPTDDFNDIKLISPITNYWFPFLFLVKVNIGTFDGSSPSYKSYDCHIDTGSEISWIQCEGCQSNGNTCYPRAQSKSIRPASCRNASICKEGKCS